MKNTLVAVTLISCSFVYGANLSAQARGTQRTQTAVADSGRTDLNTALVTLDRVSQATQTDIANLHVENWKSGWKSGFLKSGTKQAEAQQAATSLQRNLRYALPELIHNVQNSRASMSTTFKLYDDVSLVCEAVDSLINASEAAGRKSEAASLVDDYSALARVRRSLSGYIQQASAQWENHGKAPSAAVSAPPMQQQFQQQTQTQSRVQQPQQQPVQRATAPTQPASSQPASQPTMIVTDQGVKKIIIDDTIPEKQTAPAAKKKPVTLSNL
jgi:hypothetical protein